jgi:hypothetical protein
VYPKKRLGPICLSDVLSRRMALRTRYLPSGSLKKEFDEVDEVMFNDVKRPFELIFNILGFQKSDLDEEA